MVPLEEVQAEVLSACRPLPAIEATLPEALGRVLAGAVVAREEVPPFANSSMDGYAVRAADLGKVPATLTVVGALMAGDDPSGIKLGPGEAVRIMTGAAVPEGADAVVMVERTRTEEDGKFVVVEEALAPGANIRPAGDDVSTGDEVFPAGTKVGPAHIAVLASAGVERVAVHRLPRVGVVSTGDELVGAPGPLPPGKIRDSNRPGLLAQLRTDGFEAVDLGWVADEELTLRAALLDASRDCDALVTSGGVSIGDRDFARAVMERLAPGAAWWWQVAVRPAKPFAFSVIGGRVPVFGLPGNPVSAAVSYELFARPALRLMAGYPRGALNRPEIWASCEVDFPRKRDGRLHLVRVLFSRGPGGELRVRPSGGQGSHQMRPFAMAGGLALVPDGDGLAAGEQVRTWLLDPEALARP
jgi:molybdopterin molybdotransferase